MPTTHSTVSSADMSGDSDTSPANGMRKKRMLTPEIDRTLPASTVPAILAGRRHLAEVVDLTDGEDHERGEHHAERHGAGDEDGFEAVRPPADEHPAEEADEDGGAAEERGGPRVHAAVVGRLHGADPEREPPEQRRASAA